MNKSLPKLTPDQQKELWAANIMPFLPIAWTSAIGAFMGERVVLKAMREDEEWVKNLHNNFQRLQGIDDLEKREEKIIQWNRRIGSVNAEFTILQRLVKEGRLEIVGQENLENISQPNIFTSCHLSHWELAAYVGTTLPNPSCALYASPENPVFHQVALKARQSWLANFELVPASSRAMLQLTRALKRGSNLLLFIDEERDGYIWGPSLGRKLPYAGNRWLAARLAVRHQVDIVSGYVEAIADSRYRVVIEPKLEQIDGDDESRAKHLADQLDQKLDRWVRERLDQWYWLAALDLDKPLPL